RQQVLLLHEEIAALRAPHGIVGHSDALQQAIAVARKVAKHPSTVLVTGESGSGKELIAGLIHEAGPRANAPFVAVNCGAIPARPRGGSAHGPIPRGSLFPRERRQASSAAAARAA